MSFLDWYRRYQGEITWWIIGWLSMGVLDSLLNENYFWAVVNIGLIYLNYAFWKDR
jgi:hypothetical protein